MSQITKTRLETAAAVALSEAMRSDPTGETGADPAAYAAIINRDGWTLDTPAALGNTLRHEGVVFTAPELARITAEAARLFAAK